MEDESTDQPVVEQEVVSEPVEEVADQVDLDDDADAEEEVVEEIEFDFGGNKMKVRKDQIPEELAAKVDEFSKGLWSDYTKKSGEIAETRKALEAEKQAVEQLKSVNSDMLSAYSEGMAVRKELEQLQQVDINALWQSDPDRARRISDAISQKSAQFQNAVSKVDQLERQSLQAQQADVSRRAESGRQAVIKAVPNFDEKALVEYAVKNGIEPDSAKTWALNPPVAILAHKAMLYDKMTAAASKPKTSAQAATPVSPVANKGTAKGKPDLVKDADKMSADEWLRQRNAQIKQRAS